MQEQERKGLYAVLIVSPLRGGEGSAGGKQGVDLVGGDGADGLERAEGHAEADGDGGGERNGEVGMDQEMKYLDGAEV